METIDPKGPPILPITPGPAPDWVHDNLRAFYKRLRPGQVIELYHATKLMPRPLRPKCAAWLANEGLLFGFGRGKSRQYLITREGWIQLKRHWHLIADKVHGYPRARR